jgi:hypothetical protein
LLALDQDGGARPVNVWEKDDEARGRREDEREGGEADAPPPPENIQDRSPRWAVFF